MGQGCLSGVLGIDSMDKTWYLEFGRKMTNWARSAGRWIPSSSPAATCRTAKIRVLDSFSPCGSQGYLSGRSALQQFPVTAPCLRSCQRHPSNLAHALKGLLT